MNPYCMLCKRDLFAAAARGCYLMRMSPKGVPATAWKCAPDCGPLLGGQDAAVLRAIANLDTTGGTTHEPQNPT